MVALLCPPCLPPLRNRNIPQAEKKRGLLKCRKSKVQGNFFAGNNLFVLDLKNKLDFIIITDKCATVENIKKLNKPETCIVGHAGI